MSTNSSPPELKWNRFDALVALSRAGQSIVCLPAQVVVHLEGASAPDAPDVIVG